MLKNNWYSTCFSSIRHILGEQCGLDFVLTVPYTLVSGQWIGLEWPSARSGIAYGRGRGADVCWCRWNSSLTATTFHFTFLPCWICSLAWTNVVLRGFWCVSNCSNCITTAAAEEPASTTSIPVHTGCTNPGGSVRRSSQYHALVQIDRFIHIFLVHYLLMVLLWLLPRESFMVLERNGLRQQLVVTRTWFVNEFRLRSNNNTFQEWLLHLLEVTSCPAHYPDNDLHIFSNLVCQWFNDQLLLGA